VSPGGPGQPSPPGRPCQPDQPVTFPPGTRVRAACEDPDHHTRIPRYLRGHVGEVVTAVGRWPLPDDVARGVADPRVQTVYTVRFRAADLWGTGRHTVTADLWEAYLQDAHREDADNSKKRAAPGEAP
jgi:Nitrile hydratase beta subunit, C-terminal